MRCISPISRYSIQVFEAQENIVLDARGYAHQQVLKKPVIANFDTTGLMDHEIDEALTHFSFVGLPEGVSPLSKVSVFDTEAYCQQYPENERDERQIQIDNRLRELSGMFPSEFRIVEMPRKTKPWERYDEASAEDVVKMVGLLGYRKTAEHVRLYESENKNRPEVIEAMERIEDPTGAAIKYDAPAEPEEVAEAVPTSSDPEEAFAVES